MVTKESHEEDLSQLSRLVQSPAWALYSSRVLKQVQSSEQEKARALREANWPLASRLQGRSDGLREAVDLLPQLCEELQRLVKPDLGDLPAAVYP